MNTNQMGWGRLLIRANSCHSWPFCLLRHNAGRAAWLAQLVGAMVVISYVGQAFAADSSPPVPLSLHPDNPHYLLFRGKPTVLIGSTEHYGAVLNGGVDYIRYLDAIQQAGMNVTRTFSGAYVEPDGAFNIAHNTLAPAPGKFIAPWARSNADGYANGGKKFDLSRWNDQYFHRLRDFVSNASRRGIVVEMVLFCPYYEEPQWNLSPLNARNNINGIGDLPRTKANTLDNGKLLEIQDAMVRKFAAELKEFDNVYFEICNEPYFGGVTLDWQAHIAQTLRDAEKDLPRPHLIAQNISNGAKKIENPNPLVSIFNFHYATPPNAVTENYGLNKVIADDETGFKGTGDAVYRMEAWDFLMAGGAIFDNLDYSFTAGHEDGTFPLPANQPGGGTPELRKQFRILHDFIASFDFIDMKPNDAIVKRDSLPKGVTVRALAQEGKAYGIYVRGGGLSGLRLLLPAGHYRAEWVNTRTGEAQEPKTLDHAGRDMEIPAPKYSEDVALRVTAVKP